LCNPFNNRFDSNSNNSPIDDRDGSSRVVSGRILASWYGEAKAGAIAAKLPIAELDWFLQALSDLDRLALRLGTYQTRSRICLQVPFAHLQQLWQQRLEERVPLQYLAGQTAWRRFSVKVSPNVLIPRPETEYLIDLALKAAEGQRMENWADLGTGSGAIALGLAEVFPTAGVHAVDFSPKALDIARENAKNLNFGSRIKFYQGSWWEPLAAWKGKFDGMAANPPYIPSSLLPQLQSEVFRHEPHLALDGGADGLDSIRHLVRTAPNYLRLGGVWLVEVMAGQAKTTASLLEREGQYNNIQVFRDLAGIERFVLGYCRPSRERRL